MSSILFHEEIHVYIQQEQHIGNAEDEKEIKKKGTETVSIDVNMYMYVGTFFQVLVRQRLRSLYFIITQSGVGLGVQGGQFQLSQSIRENVYETYHTTRYLVKVVDVPCAENGSS